MWVIIGVAALAVIGSVYYLAEARGYAAGLRDERSTERHALSQAFRQALQQGLAAQRDIDYLYERARRQIDELS
jgi:hypothetical protein